jgi:hypothetical protein
MLKIPYDDIEVVIPLDTKISEVCNLIAKQTTIPTNVNYKLYFLGNSEIYKYAHHIYVDETNKDMPIYKIMAKLKSTLKNKSSRTYATKNKIHFPKSKIDISFERTIRVPVNKSNNSFPLPPGLGSYDLMKVADDVDEWVLPMYQCEAMWMKFYNNIYYGKKFGQH